MSVTTTFAHNKAMRDALLQFIDIAHWRQPYAITFTCKNGIVDKKTGMFVWSDEVRISKNLRHVCNVVNKKIFGNKIRNGAKFEIIAVMERNADGRLHYHLAVEVPLTAAKEQFLHLLIETWRQSDFGHKEVHLEKMLDFGWIDYMTKFRTKQEFSQAIDWDNFHLDKQSVV